MREIYYSEPGQIYEIEATLKKGYQFGNCESVDVQLYLSGYGEAVSFMNILRLQGFENGELLEDDLTVSLSYTTNNVSVNGSLVSGCRLSFQNLSVG